jgi:hypothetical protein
LARMLSGLGFLPGAGDLPRLMGDPKLL